MDPGSLVREGYKFTGWSLKQNPGEGEQLLAPGKQLKITSNTTFYAQWKPGERSPLSRQSPLQLPTPSSEAAETTITTAELPPDSPTIGRFRLRRMIRNRMILHRNHKQGWFIWKHEAQGIILWYRESPMKVEGACYRIKRTILCKMSTPETFETKASQGFIYGSL